MGPAEILYREELIVCWRPHESPLGPQSCSGNHPCPAQPYLNFIEIFSIREAPSRFQHSLFTTKPFKQNVEHTALYILPPMIWRDELSQQKIFSVWWHAPAKIWENNCLKSVHAMNWDFEMYEILTIGAWVMAENLRWKTA